MIPYPVYESLPWIYIGIAIVGLVASFSGLVIACAGTLVTLSGYILKMRRDYRRQFVY